MQWDVLGVEKERMRVFIILHHLYNHYLAQIENIVYYFNFGKGKKIHWKCNFTMIN